MFPPLLRALTNWQGTERRRRGVRMLEDRPTPWPKARLIELRRWLWAHKGDLARLAFEASASAALSHLMTLA